MIGITRFPRALASLLSLLVIAVAACADAPTAVPSDAEALSKAAGAPHQPVRLTFEKCAIAEGVWEGEVSGDIEGDLRTELTDLRITGPIWHVRFDWIIDAGAQSFVADLSGTLNTNTGRVVMNGRVADGYLEGAQVHEEGQLVDAGNLCFDGSIRIMPATAH